MMKSFLRLTSVAVLVVVCGFSSAVAQNPKHEFRGAWMHIIGQGQYARMTTAENQAYLRHQLNLLKQAGCNAVIWQIRPQADAAYHSSLEPWSRYISGTAGVAPDPDWDPLQFMITEAHNRGMELHAWINPYRVTASKGEMPAKGHIYYEHPEWFLSYADGKIYFDPGLPESRDFINKVVADILTRYDVDAIHMDDYFYPYPVEGVDFPDDDSYARYGNGMDRGDWRRQNVDMLIEQLHHTIQGIKPWVRFGISPFGVWRNRTSDPDGSETDALQCYDALYADCPKWTRCGWVDYMVPQLYWELEHKRAPALELSYWWARHANDRHMYFGISAHNIMTHHDVPDTLCPTQLNHRISLQRSLEGVHGITWWPGYTITQNFNGILDSLALHHQSTPAIIPAYTWLDSIPPLQVRQLKQRRIAGNLVLSWKEPKASGEMQRAVQYVVYRFPAGSARDFDNPANIVAVTPHTSFSPAKAVSGDCFAVTALDHCNNESAPQTVVCK